MKKIFVLFSFVFTSSAGADIVTDFSNMCGDVGYDRVYAVFSPVPIICEPGTFLPADALACASCPDGYTCNGGTFEYNETDAQGLTLNQSYIVSMGQNKLCASNIVSRRMYAVFRVPMITCEPGTFLPADALACASCPDGYTCNGGTFEPNQNEFQGLILNENTEYIPTNANNTCAVNANHVLNGIFEINTYDCAPGYYLPAGDDWANDFEGCRQCPHNNKCIGGAYTFNKTEPQGIEQCTNPTPFAPIGSAYCYEHILHIDNDVVYLKSTKLTTPSLNVGMDDGVFYANMTTIPTRMNNATERYLKIEYDGIIYYVCDDTTYSE